MAYIRKTAQTCPICGKKAEHEVFNIRNASGSSLLAGNATFKGKTMTALRSFLYWCARILGDLQAIRRGRVGKRIARRAAGRMTGRALGRLFR